jgi:multidrug transporter EmrE-like cation transporter
VREAFSPQGFWGVLEGLWTLMKQPAFGVGMFLYGFASLALVSKSSRCEQLSIAYPILVSLTFLMVTVGGYFFFRRIDFSAQDRRNDDDCSGNRPWSVFAS